MLIVHCPVNWQYDSTVHLHKNVNDSKFYEVYKQLYTTKNICVNILTKCNVIVKGSLKVN